MIVAWISFFPVEWLTEIPSEVSRIPRGHPATWQRVLLAELENIPALSIHVIVLRKEFERNQVFVRNNVTFHLVKTVGGLRASSFFWHDTQLIKHELRAIRPDLVHAWGTENGAALVASRLRCPYLVTVQGLSCWLAQLMPLTPYERFAAFLERLSLPRAKIITAESRFSSQFVKRMCPRTDIRHIDVVPDPLFNGMKRFPVTCPSRILYNATLGPRKGGDLLLLALDSLIEEFDFELMVIGSVSQEFLRTMKAITSEKLWRRVKFRQSLSTAQVATELALAGLFVCPTRADTGPMAVKEAAVAGVPIVASQIGGIPDYVYSGRNGILFQSESLSGLIDALRVAMHHPVFGRGLVEPSALNEIRAYLSAERMGRRFWDLYQSISKSGHSSS